VIGISFWALALGCDKLDDWFSSGDDFRSIIEGRTQQVSEFLLGIKGPMSGDLVPGRAYREIIVIRRCSGIVKILFCVEVTYL